MQWQGGVYDILMQREEMDAENLREEVIEVALKQWTERNMSILHANQRSDWQMSEQ